jgi:hypothetical protein
VFTKDGFFRNVWVAVKNTVTGTIYLQTQPYYNYVKQQVQDAQQAGTYRTADTDSNGTVIGCTTNYYCNEYDPTDIKIRVIRDTEIYDDDGQLYGTIHGHTNPELDPVVAVGANTEFDMGLKKKEYVAVAGFQSINTIAGVEWFTLADGYQQIPDGTGRGDYYIKVADLANKLYL